jgi:hypothetical protein
MGSLQEQAVFKPKVHREDISATSCDDAGSITTSYSTATSCDNASASASAFTFDGQPKAECCMQDPERP